VSYHISQFVRGEINCGACGTPLWAVADQGGNVHAPTHCARCKVQVGYQGPVVGSTALESFRLPPGVEQELTNHLIQRRDALVADLRQLMAQAFAPIEERQRTFWDWLCMVDWQTEQIKQKYQAGQHLNSFILQRTHLVQNLRKMVLAVGELAHVEVDSQLKLLKGRVELLRLEAEQRKLEVERFSVEQDIARRQALLEPQIRTLQLEETKKHTRLLNEINPPAPLPVIEIKAKDPLKQAITAQRRRLKAKATAKQLLISDFLKDLQKVFRGNLGDPEKAARIRAVMEVYNQEPDALPKDIREFLEEVESAEVTRRG
jgi:hypothetical protein